MTSLEELLGVESTPSQRLATALVESDVELLRALVEVRRSAGMSQQDVARALGVTQPTVAAFERLGNDPRLSTIRRYAHAVGAYVQHVVDVEPVQERRASGGWLRRPLDGPHGDVSIAGSVRISTPAPEARGKFALAA